MSAISLSEIHRYFAHTNSAKCKNLARGRKQGPAKLFNNCRSFVPGEVESLRPDLIVTQGKWARRAVETFLCVRRAEMPEHPEYGCAIVQVGGREVIKFETYHQAAFGKFWPEKKIAYPWHVQMAADFLMSGGGDCWGENRPGIVGARLVDGREAGGQRR